MIHAGHFGRFAAHQGAACKLAAGGDARDDGFGHVEVEFAGGVVVEEEQRLRALHGDIVDAHGDEVDADTIVAPRVDGEAQLGADSVGARNQYRFAITLRQAHQRAETADAGQHFGAVGTAHQGLDAFDERVACVDVYASVSVGQSRGGRHVEMGGACGSGGAAVLYRSPSGPAPCAIYPTSSAFSACS